MKGNPSELINGVTDDDEPMGERTSGIIPSALGSDFALIDSFIYLF